MILANLSRKVDSLLAQLGDMAEVKFFVICPDEPSRVIELDYVHALEGGDGSVVIQLKANEAQKDISKL